MCISLQLTNSDICAIHNSKSCFRIRLHCHLLRKQNTNFKLPVRYHNFLRLFVNLYRKKHTYKLNAFYKYK